MIGIPFKTHVMNLNDLEFGNIRGASANRPFGIVIYGDLGLKEASQLRKQIIQHYETAIKLAKLHFEDGNNGWIVDEKLKHKCKDEK